MRDARSSESWLDSLAGSSISKIAPRQVERSLDERRRAPRTSSRHGSRRQNRCRSSSLRWWPATAAAPILEPPVNGRRSRNGPRAAPGKTVQEAQGPGRIVGSQPEGLRGLGRRRTARASPRCGLGLKPNLRSGICDSSSSFWTVRGAEQLKDELERAREFFAVRDGKNGTDAGEEARQ